MKTGIAITTLLSILLLAGGCVSLDEYNRVVAENESYLSRIQGLETAQERDGVGVSSLRSQLANCEVQNRACNERVALLESARAGLMSDMERLAQQVGHVVALPVELSDALSSWAMRQGDVVSYDPETGIVRFKSDLLFDPGSATLQDRASNQVRSLAAILNSPAAENFDVLVVGHTDDIPIGQPETLRQHPTNWFLSAHRAIAVQKVLAEAGVPQDRTAVVGMGQFRPIAPNGPSHSGNPLNRRVEIYIVPAGSLQTGGGA